MALGRGGISAVARETGLSWNTIKRGIREIEEELPHLAESIERQDQQRIRQPGAGRPRRSVEDPTLVKHLEKLWSRSRVGIQPFSCCGPARAPASSLPN